MPRLMYVSQKTNKLWQEIVFAGFYTLQYQGRKGKNMFIEQRIEVLRRKALA